MRKKMSKWQFERLMRRYDGEGGGGAAPAAPATDPTPTVPATTPATPTEPTQPFKAFASQADYDREIQQAIKSHEAKLTAKLTPAIKAQLEAEANMTAEQKLQAERDAFEAEKKALAAERNRIKAETILKDVPEAERAIMLDSIVSDDLDATEARAKALAEAVEKATNEKIKVAMKSVTVPNSTSGSSAKGDTPDVTYAKDLAARRAQATKSSNDTLNYYLGGNKK